jgi:hypothetical protein
MTGSHSRLVAVQTVVVGVLMVVVFVTLLQPEAETPISGIEGPAGGGRTELPAPDVYTGAANDRDEQNEDRPGQTGGRPDEPAPSGTEGLGLTGPPSETGDTGYLPPEGEEDKPSDDQYTDSLTRLMLRVD